MMIEKIYNGQIYPAETVIPKSREFQEKEEAIHQSMTYFEQILSKEDYARLETLCDYYADCEYFQSQEHFKDGLVMGILLMNEVYGYAESQTEK